MILLAGLGTQAALAAEPEPPQPPIVRPSHPIRLCIHIRPHRHKFSCLPFDARRLIGLTLPAAVRLARHYGYSVRRERPLGPHEGVTEDYRTGRIDVETDAPANESTVIRIMGRG
ncbi:MAG: hypothetical protein ACYDHT_03610 [Solirubrobacteraceae bacterium]